jgi:hypothetical protein
MIPASQALATETNLRSPEHLIVSKIGQPNNEHSQPFLMLVQLLLCRLGCCFRAFDIRSTPGFRTLVTPPA